MPWSSDEGKPFIRSKLIELGANSVLDVGAGAGYYGKLVREIRRHAIVDAVEIWEPYVERFGLTAVYDEIFVSDARTFEPRRDYDVIVFGDVIEHMAANEAVEMVTRYRRFANSVIIALPIIEWHQGECEGNPYEAHVHHWDDAQVQWEFDPTQSWVGDSIGVYVLPGMAK